MIKSNLVFDKIVNDFRDHLKNFTIILVLLYHATIDKIIWYKVSYLIK